MYPWKDFKKYLENYAPTSHLFNRANYKAAFIKAVDAGNLGEKVMKALAEGRLYGSEVYDEVWHNMRIQENVRAASINKFLKVKVVVHYESYVVYKTTLPEAQQFSNFNALELALQDRF